MAVAGDTEIGGQISAELLTLDARGSISDS